MTGLPTYTLVPSSSLSTQPPKWDLKCKSCQSSNNPTMSFHISHNENQNTMIYKILYNLACFYHFHFDFHHSILSAEATLVSLLLIKKPRHSFCLEHSSSILLAHLTSFFNLWLKYYLIIEAYSDHSIYNSTDMCIHTHRNTPLSFAVSLTLLDITIWIINFCSL